MSGVLIFEGMITCCSFVRSPDKVSAYKQYTKYPSDLLERHAARVTWTFFFIYIVYIYLCNYFFHSPIQYNNLNIHESEGVFFILPCSKLNLIHKSIYFSKT